MRTQRACQVFNAHLNKTACRFNKPIPGFCGFARSFSRKVVLGDGHHLIKGISNYMFRKIIISHPNPDARCHTCWRRAIKKKAKKPHKKTLNTPTLQKLDLNETIGGKGPFPFSSCSNLSPHFPYCLNPHLIISYLHIFLSTCYLHFF